MQLLYFIIIGGSNHFWKSKTVELVSGIAKFDGAGSSAGGFFGVLSSS